VKAVCVTLKTLTHKSRIELCLNVQQQEVPEPSAQWMAQAGTILNWKHFRYIGIGASGLI